MNSKKNFGYGRFVGCGVLAFCLWLCVFVTRVFVWTRIDNQHTVNEVVFERPKVSREDAKLDLKNTDSTETSRNRIEFIMSGDDLNSAKVEYRCDRTPKGLKNDTSFSNELQDATSHWLVKYTKKIDCVKFEHLGVFYMYHARKTAGSSLSSVVEKVSRLLRLKFLSTEGVVVDNCAFAEDVISFIVIRNPIERIFSLYWYEHVDFYYNIKNQPFKTKSFKVWMEAWLDGSTWKREISNKYSYENYVEIENYYIKTLIGWKGDENRTININDYRKACCILERHFDVIFLTEWLEHRNQSLLLDRIHPGASGFFIPKVVGKKKFKKKFVTQIDWRYI